MRKYSQSQPHSQISLSCRLLLLTVRTDCEKYWRNNGEVTLFRAACSSSVILVPTLKTCLVTTVLIMTWNGEPVLGITPGMSSGPQLYLCSRALLSSSLKGFPRVLSTLFFSSHLQFNGWWRHSLFLHILVSDSWTDSSCLTYTGCWTDWVGHIVTLTTTLVPNLSTFLLLFKYFGLCSPFCLDPFSSLCIHTNSHKSQFWG